jgi:hypothetical protein
MGQSARLGTAHPYARRHRGPGQAVLTRMLKNVSASFSHRSNQTPTGTQPPHHSAACTDLVLRIRRTMRHKRVRLGPSLAAALQESPLSLLREALLLSQMCRQSKFCCPKWCSAAFGAAAIIQSFRECSFTEGLICDLTRELSAFDYDDARACHRNSESWQIEP